MGNLNKVLLMGNITRDIELRYTPSGLAIAKMGLATNRKFRDSKTNELREEVTFVDIDIFGKTAEFAHQYLGKGRPVFVEGRLKYDQWDDKQTGQKRSKLYVVADSLQFVGPPPQGGTRPANPPAQRPGGAAPAPSAPSAPQQDSGPEDLEIREENIPF